MGKKRYKEGPTPTDRLAARVEQNQHLFGLRQNITSSLGDCKICHFLDLCTRGDNGGKCPKVERDAQIEDEQNPSSVQRLFGQK